MSSPAGQAPHKVVLAYSGGLDTSCIIPWLKEQYGDVQVIATAVDVGQPDDLSQIEAKALASGAARAYVSDAREEFLREYVFPTLRAGAVYEPESTCSAPRWRGRSSPSIRSRSRSSKAPTRSPMAARARAMIRSASS